MSNRTAAAALAVLCFALPLARAQEPPEVAAAHRAFDAGVAHYQAGDYGLCATEFGQARELMRHVGRPTGEVIAFNEARCLEELRRDREAIAAYEAYLRAPAAAGDPNRADAEQRLTELRARVALSPQGASPGPIGFVVGAAGVAMIVAGVITGGLALAADSDATAGCVGERCPASLAGRADDAHALAIATDVLLFGGVGLAAIGTLFLFLIQDSPSQPQASAMCDAHGCRAAMLGRF